MPRATASKDDIESCGLSFSELQELWLGVGPNGSLFHDEAELRAAWERGRDVCMRIWASGGRRPQAWWYLEAPALGLKWPGHDAERSCLYTAGALTEAERAELEAEWRRDFDQARGKSAKERREHLAFHDVPAELIELWTGERRKRTKSSPPVEAHSEANNAPAGLRTGVAAPLK